MKRIFLAALLVTSGYLTGGHGYVAGADLESSDAERLVGSSRLERSGWIHVHLQGSPDRIGYQHGYLLADEIADFLRVIKPYLEKSSKRDWNFYRQTAEQMLWPRVDSEYQREIDGIVAGLQAKGVQADRWDLVALNANQELPYYYVPWLDKKEGKAADRSRSGQLQRDHRHRELHQRPQDRHGAQRLDELCCRDEMEHHLRP